LLQQRGGGGTAEAGTDDSDFLCASHGGLLLFSWLAGGICPQGF